MLVGLLTVMPLAGWEMTRQPIHITVEAVAAIAYLGIVVTVVGLILWLYLLRVVPARVAARCPISATRIRYQRQRVSLW